MKGAVAAYGIAIGINRLAAFLLLPLLTASLNPSQYGVYSILQLVYLCLLALTVHGLDEAGVRFGSTSKCGQANISSFLFKESLLSSLIAVIIGFSFLIILRIFIPVLIPAALTVNGVVALLGWVVADALFLPMIAVVRAEKKVLLASFLLLTQGILLWLLTWFFLTHTNLSLTGILLASVLATVIPLSILVGKQSFTTMDFTVPTTDIKRAIRQYAWPAGLMALCVTGINFSDRLLVSWLLTTHETGLYASAYRFGMGVSLALTAFRMAWYPVIFENLDKNQTAPSRTITRTLLGLSIIALLITIFREPIASFELFEKSLIAEPFRAGLIVVPWIALAYLLDGAATIADAPLFHSGRTKTMLLIVVFSWAINIFSAIKLIPLYGITGAAASTLIAFAFQLFAADFMSLKLCKTRLLSFSHYIILIFTAVIISLYETF